MSRCMKQLNMIFGKYIGNIWGKRCKAPMAFNNKHRCIGNQAIKIQSLGDRNTVINELLIDPTGVFVNGTPIIRSPIALSVELTFTNVAAGRSSSQTIAISGALPGASISLIPPENFAASDFILMAWVSTANTAIVRAFNSSATTQSLTGIFGVIVR